MEVKTKTRQYNFYLNASQSTKEILRLYDLPTTLSGIKKAIEMYLPKNFVGETAIENLLKKREISNFIKTLSYLISKRDYTKKTVKIEVIDF